MDNENRDRNRDRDMDSFHIGHLIVRILVTAIVVGIAAYFTPGFSIDSIWSLLLAAVVVAILNHLVQTFTGVHASPFGRGFTGFIVSAIILYATKFIIPGFNISIWGALIGAVVIGIVDAIIPGKTAL